MSHAYFLVVTSIGFTSDAIDAAGLVANRPQLALSAVFVDGHAKWAKDPSYLKAPGVAKTQHELIDEYAKRGADFKQRWLGRTPDVAATISTSAEWDRIFSEGEILARAVRLHSGRTTNDYLTMSTTAATLLDVPAPLQRGVARGTQGSIYFMGRRISGRYSYGAGLYRERVLAILQAMVRM